MISEAWEDFWSLLCTLHFKLAFFKKCYSRYEKKVPQRNSLWHTSMRLNLLLWKHSLFYIPKVISFFHLKPPKRTMFVWNDLLMGQIHRSGPCIRDLNDRFMNLLSLQVTLYSLVLDLRQASDPFSSSDSGFLK